MDVFEEGIFYTNGAKRPTAIVDRYASADNATNDIIGGFLAGAALGLQGTNLAGNKAVPQPVVTPAPVPASHTGWKIWAGIGIGAVLFVGGYFIFKHKK